jgi:hypothetical protein
MRRSIVLHRQRFRSMTLKGIPKMKSSIIASVAEHPDPLLLRPLVAALLVGALAIHGRQDASHSYPESVERH